MKLGIISKIIIVSIGLFGSLLHAATPIDWQVCFDEKNLQCTEVAVGSDLYQKIDPKIREVWYKSTFTQPRCARTSGCWIFLGEIADTADILLNNSSLARFDDSKGRLNYLRDAGKRQHMRAR